MPRRSDGVRFVIGFVDTPTDGVVDYCGWLARALVASGIAVDTVTRRTDGSWDPVRPWSSGAAVSVVQFTALAWSRRGFPLRLLPVLWRLKRRGERLMVVLHDPSAFPSAGLVAWVRRTTQITVMRVAIAWADKTVVTVEPELVPWLAGLPTRDLSKIAHVPVGSNVSFGAPTVRHEQGSRHPFTISVFCVAGPGTEVAAVGNAVARAARQVDLRLQVFGRGGRGAESTLSKLLEGTGVDLRIEDVLPPDVVSQRFAESDAFLFLRGGASTRRGSLIAAISAGLPTVATRGPETGPAIERCGILWVEQDDAAAAAAELVRLARDPALRAELRSRNLTVTREVFSWQAIAKRFLDLLER